MKSIEELQVEYRNEQLSIAARMRRRGPDLVVFLHGLGCSSESFDGAFEHLDSGLSICAIDFPSHGLSEPLPANLTSLHSYADVVSSILRQIEHRRLFIIGHSMGGAVGLLAAPRASGLTTFVSVEGNLVKEDCGLVSRRTAVQGADDFAKHGFRKFVEELNASSRADLRMWGTWLARCERYGLHAAARSLVELSDSGQLLNQFNALPSKAYVYGAKSDLGYILPTLGRSTPTYSIDNSEHFPMIDCPHRFYGVLNSLLTSTSTRRPAELLSL